MLENLILGGKRYFLLKTLHHYRKLGYNQKHIILVGSGILAKKYLTELEHSPQLGYHVVGYIASETDEENLNQLPYLGNYGEMEQLLEKIIPEEVVVAMSPQDYKKTEEVINLCEKTGTKMMMIPFFAQFFPANPQIDYLHNLPMLHLRPNPLEYFLWAFVKRSMDFLGALLLLILFAPLLLCLAVGVKLSTKGSVIFKQIRVGKGKKEFCMYKFRSMSQGNPEEEQAWTTQSNPRKTKFGALIRKCSLDELPQLFNVLKGDMSLVGPRPELPVFVEKFKEEIPHYMVKHQVRPGITGWAQVSGLRGDTSIPDRIRHDIFYIEHWHLCFDLKILFLTVFCGMINKENLRPSTKQTKDQSLSHKNEYKKEG